MLTTLLSWRTLTIGCLLTLATLPAFHALAVPITEPGRAVPESSGDRIIGRWYFPMRESNIEIYRENSHYFARITAVSQATADKFGEMANKMLLTDLSFANDEWAGGQLIHPQTGHRFDVFLKLTNAHTLVITAFKGCRLFSKAYTLTRI